MSYQSEGLITPDEHCLTYDRYLKVSKLLSLQQELSEPKAHDETLFIIIHQVYELWFKQILHEMDRCSQRLAEGKIIQCLRALRRIDTIQQVLIHQVDILETMAPDEFNHFRNRLNPASGFQSFQFRLLEFKLGLRDPNYLKYFQHEQASHRALEQAMQEPSFYDTFFSFLQQQGYSVPAAVLQRDLSKPHQANEDVVQLLKEIYSQAEEQHDLYSLIEAMIDLDEKLLLWRYRHMAMVQRMIGDLQGTGGSKGASYLARTLGKKAFPELWQVRNRLGQG